MREYARFSGRFWTGPTGRAIKAKGRDAQVLAVYLFTGPQSNMIGLYYLPLVALCHEAGYTLEEARATLAVLAAIGFAYYDEEEELVWVPQAARYQIGEALAEKDNRAKGVKNLLKPYQRHKFGRQFVSLYRAPYSLYINDDAKDLQRSLQAPSKPGEGTGTGTGAGAGNNDPPTPPADAGGPRSVSGKPPARSGNRHGNGQGLKGAALEDATNSLVAYWRHLARVDRNGWTIEPATVPPDKTIRGWKRCLRNGRFTVSELQAGISNHVHAQLIDRGRLVGDEPWPPQPDDELDLLEPSEDAQPPPLGDPSHEDAIRASLDRRKP